MSRRQKPQPEILGNVGILIFVDEDVFEPALILGQNIIVLLENRNHVQKQITEVTGIKRLQAVLVLHIQFRPTVIKRLRLGRGQRFRRPCTVFPIVDHTGQQPRGPAFFVDIVGHDQLLQQPDLVVCIENGEVGF